MKPMPSILCEPDGFPMRGCAANTDLGRFTVDRLISIINRLGCRVELRIKLRPAKPAA
jgi:hypothetical protein